MSKTSSRRRFQEYLKEVQVRRRESIPVRGQHGDFHSQARTDTLERSHRSSWKLLTAFWGLLQGFRGKVLFGLATLTISTLLSLVPPLATKVAIDSVLTVPPLPLSPLLTKCFGDLTGMRLLGAVAGIAILIAMFQTVIRLWGRWVSTQAVNQAAVMIRRRVFKHILHLPLHRIYTLKSGGATSMLREDAGGVADLIFSMLYNPSQAIVQLSGSLVILVFVDWRLLAAGVLLLPIVYFSHRWYIYSIRPLFRDVRQQRQGVDSTTTESFGGIRVVRTFARQQTETNRFVQGNHLLVRQQLMVWWRTRIIELIWEVLIPLSSTVLLLYGGWQILQGELTLGELMMFLVYLTMLLGPLATLTGSAVQFQNNLAGLDRILDVLESPTELPDRSDARRLSQSEVQGAMKLENVSFKYPGSDVWVLKNISMTIEPNQTIALVGRSGAGKTTLCNLIARFYDPDEGRILLDGQDLRELELHSYRRLLGVVEQDVFLFDGSIAENIAFGRRGASRNDIQEAAAVAAASEFIEKLPHSFDSLIGERGVKLSGGQRQRLAIARAILADPKILILDEATSNLDSESERLIQKSLERLRQNRTSFVIAHRLSTVATADQIWVLDEGTIIQSGTHQSLLAEEGLYQRMVRLQTDATLG
ncbi:MAG: ABC transporter ATP-binding protein [Pirellulaceae bacterium]|nr:ABC transporter ATP-binding protein [Pirellulaceae bacterium]